MGVQITLLKNKNYLRMPWKNGRGFTSEIAIFPQGSQVTNNNFAWRLSTAEVTENGPFSSFPQCERYLAVIEGQGIRLHFENEDKMIDQNNFFQFSGDEKVQGELVKGQIRDLNLIVKKTDHQVTFEIIEETQIQMVKVVTMVFVIEGFVTVSDVRAEKFDTLLIEPEQNENQFSILPGSKTKYVLITIS